jgi:hypothetical protein
MKEADLQQEVKPFRVLAKQDEARIVYIGSNKIEIPPQTYSYEYCLRPDIKETYVADVIEQLLLPYGGLVRENSSGISLKLEIVNDLAENLWSRLVMYIGVNLHFQRVLFLTILPAIEQSSFVKKISQYINTNSEYDLFSEDIANRLHSAFQSDEILFQSTVPLASFIEEDASFESSICSVNYNNANSQIMCEGIVDVAYICNLQTTFAQLMNLKLQYEVDAVDQSMKSVELKCAKLMTLLKPTYQRSNLQLPSPPQNKPLSLYPLTLKRDSIRDLSLDTCRLFLLRARKAYRDYCSSEPTVSSFPLDKQYNHQLSFIVINLLRQFREWVEEEYKIRIKRKIDSVKDRLESLQHFKIQLLLVLHDRFNINNISNGGMISGLSNSIWSLSAFNQDRNFQLALQEKFPFIDFNEPVIHDSQCIMHQKTGTLYITAGHLLFYSISTLMTTPLLIVIPMRTIVQLQLYGGGKANYTSSYNHEESNDSILRNHSLGLSMTSGDSIKLTDSGQQDIMIRFTDNTPEYAARIFDLIDLLLKVSINPLLKVNHT